MDTFAALWLDSRQPPDVEQSVEHMHPQTADSVINGGHDVELRVEVVEESDRGLPLCRCPRSIVIRPASTSFGYAVGWKTIPTGLPGSAEPAVLERAAVARSGGGGLGGGICGFDGEVGEQTGDL